MANNIKSPLKPDTEMCLLKGVFDGPMPDLSWMEGPSRKDNKGLIRRVIAHLTA